MHTHATTYGLIDAFLDEPYGQEPLARFLANHGTPMAGARLSRGERPFVTIIKKDDHP